VSTGRRFLHLTVIPKGPLDVSVVDARVNNAKDWIRYAPTCWLLWTSRDPQYWHERLRAVPELRSHQLFVFVADLSERQGWLPSDVWAWINKHKVDDEFGAIARLIQKAKDKDEPE
jgi:hypothetical protein